MRLLSDKNAGLMATGEIAGGEEIHAALRQHIGAVQSEAHTATVVPISIALPRTASYGGVFQPEELEILQRVFDRICRDKKCRPTATDTTAPAPTAPATAEAPATADQPATTEAPAAPSATDETKTAAIDKSQLKEIPAGEIRSEELIGTTVYGANDKNVGEIGDVVLSTDGKVDSIIIDVGGFLGIGEKEVAVGTENLAFMTDKDGNKYLYTNFTKEQLEAAAAYDKSTYSEKRERLIMKQ